MSVPAPDWVSYDAENTGGLNLLGLRAPVQQIGNHLLNGLTSVTPKLRYLPLLTWIAWKYAQARLPDSRPDFRRFAAAQEAAVVMANLANDRTHGRTTLRLVGSDEATTRLASVAKAFTLEPLVKNIAFNIYAAASVQLNLTFQKADTGIHGVTRERGLPLAQAFDNTVGRTRYAARLTGRPRLDSASRADIEELGRRICLDEIPAREKRLLIDALLPAAPVDGTERRRIGTLALLLWLAARKKTWVDEADLFEAAREPPRAIPAVLQPTLDGWLDYQIRDVLAIAHEAVMAAVLDEVDLSSARRRAPAVSSEVVAALLNATGEHNDALREIGLPGLTETVGDVSFAQVNARLGSSYQDRPIFSDGLRRWRGGLSESELAARALAAGPAATALLPVAWCLAAYRVAPDDAVPPTRQVVDVGAFFQIGLRAVILPKLDEFLQERRSYLDVMAELITRTVQQHLRVAWQRFATQGQDVSVLAADLDTWARIKDSKGANKAFNAGRTETRLGIAIDWLARELQRRPAAHPGNDPQGVRAAAPQRCRTRRSCAFPPASIEKGFPRQVRKRVRARAA
jgi:hypothetical protein